MNESDSAARLARIPARVHHVHLIGVAGTAMAAVAGMLAERGFRVCGSDNQFYEPSASLLATLNVERRTGFSAANLSPAPDLAIVGNVIIRGNPEAQALLASAIPYLSMPEALWHFFLRERRVLMVAGTHGKTTSTAMMARVLAAAGHDPSMLVGGVAKDFGSNYRLGAGRDFVIEGDEYDTAFFDKGPKFLHYRAHGAIITAVEFDHADIYRDLAHVKSAFRALAERMEAAGVLAVCADSPAALEVTAGTRAKRITFGLGAGEIRATALGVDAGGAHFSIERDGAAVARGLHLPIGGRMNVANALGVAALLIELGVGADALARGFESFGGVARRQEVAGEVCGVTVVDDFAHHPTAIRATLDAIAERFAGRRILAAFEPRSNTARRNVLQAEFAAAFDRAARVYLAPVYFKENDPIPPDGRLSVETLAGEISRRGPAAFACASTDEIVARINADARPGDIALIMSNGPFDNLKERLLAALGGKTPD
ncbi:MAG TPA: Mur ligase family protein [Candidatus Binataceae bacterium]|nr:Mur ligase family protein [Candidatus Binataceae bacterium]